jgi:hypothetical protein
LSDVPVDYLNKAFLDMEELKQQVGGNHYKEMKIQPIEYIMANELGWCEGNAVKYVTRYKQKGQAQDIEKAIHYLQILLESLKNA